MIAAAALTATVSSASASADFTTMQLNGNASATAADLSLTHGATSEASSAFFTTPILSGVGFHGAFDFTLIGGSGQGDGLSFLLQNDPNGARALGVGGGYIGAGGVQNAVGIGFQSWVNNHATIFTTATGPFGGSQPSGNFNLGGQDDSVHVTFSYSAATGILAYVADNVSTGQSIQDQFAANLSGLGASIFVGFTGATGAFTSHEDVKNFDITIQGAPEPSTWAMMALGFAGLGFAGCRRRGFAGRRR